MLAAWVKTKHPKILELRFENTLDLCRACYRFSHFYEVPEWKGKTFSRKELDAFYYELKGDKDYWIKKWGGANVPGYSIEAFRKTMKSMTLTEASILEKTAKLDAPYYLIFTAENALEARIHELAHGLWHVEGEYQNRAQGVINRYLYTPEVQKAIKYLKDNGYDDTVLMDELHAYCGVYYKEFFKPLNIKVPSTMTNSLVKLFDEYL